MSETLENALDGIDLSGDSEQKGEDMAAVSNDTHQTMPGLEEANIADLRPSMPGYGATVNPWYLISSVQINGGWRRTHALEVPGVGCLVITELSSDDGATFPPVQTFIPNTKIVACVDKDRKRDGTHEITGDNLVGRTYHTDKLPFRELPTGGKGRVDLSAQIDK